MPRRSPRRAFAALLCLAGLAGVTACGDRDGGTTPRTPMRIALTPRFQAGIESAQPVSRIRIIAHPALVGDGYVVLPDTLGVTDVRVDPGASEWRLSVAFPPPADTGWVVATIELIHEPTSGPAVVEWSGQTDPIEVVRDRASTVESVALGRGPLANLSIYDVQVRLSRTSTLEGDTVAATASTFPQGAPATVFWGSLDTAVATITAGGSIRTRRDGVARITATVGFQAETVALQVLQRPASITLAPDSLVLTANAPQGAFTATVRDARGAPITTGTSGALTWSIADTSVARSVGNGQFQLVNRAPGGRTIVTARAVSAPTVTASAPLVVR